MRLMALTPAPPTPTTLMEARKPWLAREFDDAIAEAITAAALFEIVFVTSGVVTSGVVTIVSSAFG